MTMDDTVPTLFTVWGTPIKVKPILAANLLGLWGLLSWLAGRGRPERPWPLRLVVGALATLALLVADVGHAMAHIVSAHFAGAPMDEILLSEGMPRTIYYDNNVSPQAHRTRALGGPIYSAVGLALSFLLRLLAPRDSLLRELAGWSCLGHAFILSAALAPLPFVDGGAILKWTLVERGRTPEEAGETVKQASLAVGATALSAGAALATKRRWLPALGLLAAGGIAIAAALDKIR
jgi:hypothetical protein